MSAPASVLKSDTEIIKQYLDECTTNGLSESSAKTVASHLCGVSRKFPNFKKMDTKIASAAFSMLRQTKKPNTARRAMHILKQFVQWMSKKKINTKIDLESIKNIKLPSLEYDTKQASDMLSGKEIEKMMEAAHNDRDRALIAMVYEGALRPIEAECATWDNLNFDKYGAQFTTSKKTGKPRYVRLIMSAPYLLRWKNACPSEITINGSIFTSLKAPYEPLTIWGIKSAVMTAIKKSGIKKKVSTYYLRHSRVTQMMKDGITESVIKLQGWGSLRTNMLSTYTHLTNADMDKVLLTHAGIVTEPEKDKEVSLKPRQCSHCGKVNLVTAKFCDECGTGLTPETKKQVLTIEQKVAEMYQKFQEDQMRQAVH
jgi:site-specific recombinase XerD